MTLRQILANTLPLALDRDARLIPVDIAVYLTVSCNRATSLYAQAQQRGMKYETLRRSVHRLVEYGWVQMVSKGRGLVVYPWMPLEVEEVVANELVAVRDEVPYMGEWLMKCLLDLIVLDSDYGDNVRPSWLVSGQGSGRFELDRWYRSAKVAFEFQGPQHFRVASPFASSPIEVNEQPQRDHLKAAICNLEGIRLVQVTAADLNYRQMRSRAGEFFALAPKSEHRPIQRALEKLCRGYINHASKEERRAETRDRNL